MMLSFLEIDAGSNLKGDARSQLGAADIVEEGDVCRGIHGKALVITRQKRDQSSSVLR